MPCCRCNTSIRPRDLGWLPRPDHGLHVLRHGQSFDPELDDQGCVLYPGGQEPMELGLLFRPYAFMEAGDEVADADGATWRFAHPGSWRSPQG